MMKLALVLLLLSAACAAAEPPAVVLVGATGNLAGKYLWQALFDFSRQGIVGRVYGGATRKPEEGTAQVQKMLDEKLKCSIVEQGEELDACKAAMKAFKEGVEYVQLKKEPDYESLGKTLAENGAANGGLLVYLSVSPDYYGGIAGYISRHLRPAATSSPDGWLRVVLEKPFGRDAGSAAELAHAVDAELEPQQVCKVDHYLGKEAVLAIARFRAANQHSYEPLLNNQHVASVEITMQETEDCEGRTWFYERYGAVRDVHQNHLSEILALLTAEISDGSTMPEEAARTALLEAVPPPTVGDCYFGQYEGYEAHTVADETPTHLAPTAATITLHVNTPRWEGVPFNFVSAKAMDRREAFVNVIFKPDGLPKAAEQQRSNEGKPSLRFQIQGGTKLETAITASAALPKPSWQEGWADATSLYWDDGKPTAGTTPTEHFHERLPEWWVGAPTKTAPPAYHVLMHAALVGEMGAFVSSPELTQLWRIWTPLVTAFDAGEARTGVYAPGSKRGAWHNSASKETKGHAEL